VQELGRWLFLAAALPYVVLGILHAVHTPRRPEDRKGLSPSDAALPAAMKASPLRLTRRTDVWLAWVGFNFSHSLGVVMLGVVALLVARDPVTFACQGPFFRPLAIVVSALYLVLAARYWFRTPIAGCALSLVLFVASWILS
jgi:hypothetical protein